MSDLQERINRLLDRHGYVAVMEAVREVVAEYERKRAGRGKERTLCHEVLCAGCPQKCPQAGGLA